MRMLGWLAREKEDENQVEAVTMNKTTPNDRDECILGLVLMVEPVH
jgi:hypothetical protein